ncbi:MAG: PaaI family thioesterase [Pyrinomonadaceae bacterium]
MPETLKNERTRTFSWTDADEIFERIKHLSGREFLEKMLAGELPPPPIASALNYRISEVGEGSVVFETEVAEFHYNPMAIAHGGLAATLLDTAMSCAIYTVLPPGVGNSTIELKVNYLRPMTIRTGRVRCEGKIINVGRRTALSEGRITDEAGKLYAHATTTCMILRNA